jgi:ribose/xylose/arabinose/galactoside ABC-type transport system permease subunit
MSQPTTATTAATARFDSGGNSFQSVFNRMGAWLVVALLVLLGAIAFQSDFLKTDNLMTIVRAITIIGIVSVGVAFITYGGHYVDLSIPSIMICTGFVTTSLLPYGIVVSLAGGVGVALLIGCINGYIVGYLRLNPIIWTLAMNFLLEGVLRMAYRGMQVYPETAEGTAGHAFLQLYNYELPLRIPLMTGALLVLTLWMAWLMGRTRFGRLVQFTGASYEAARHSGVDVRRVVLLTFVLSSFTTAIAAIFLTSGSQAATFELGKGFDFAAITAVVLGGVLLTGGRGSIAGVLGGVLVIGLLDNLLVLGGTGSFDQMLVRGLVFIAVVALTSYGNRKGGRS